LNFFLYINRKLVFIFGIILTFIFLILIFSKQLKLNKFEIEILETNLSNVDIAEPKFAINNDSKKIYITANEGNFLNKNEILLKDNVKFKSNEFSIETEEVIFNRNNQTAKSNTKAFFKSKNTTISSDGFDINDKGNNIIFYGKSYIVLK
tara:strand:- start:352 stop:801 length:450 start_codon:yes stop_codon:yes gene_type:complete